MKTRSYLILTAICILIHGIIYAQPLQDDFYHKYYKIESKGFYGKVLTRSPKTHSLISPELREHVSLYDRYLGNNVQKWIIAPVSSGSEEFFIINKGTGYPLMIDYQDNNTIKCNTSGITKDSQRFIFKNFNGDYFQIRSAYTNGCFYKKHHDIHSSSGQVVGDYYSLMYSTDQSINDDYSYFKLTEVEDIPGSEHVSSTNLVSQPDMLFCIPEPPQLSSYTDSPPFHVN